MSRLVLYPSVGIGQGECPSSSDFVNSRTANSRVCTVALVLDERLSSRLGSQLRYQNTPCRSRTLNQASNSQILFMACASISLDASRHQPQPCAKSKAFICCTPCADGYTPNTHSVCFHFYKGEIPETSIADSLGLVFYRRETPQRGLVGSEKHKHKYVAWMLDFISVGLPSSCPPPSRLVFQWLVFFPWKTNLFS